MLYKGTEGQELLFCLIELFVSMLCLRALWPNMEIGNSLVKIQFKILTLQEK